MKSLTDVLSESLLDVDYSPSDYDVIRQFIHEYCALQPKMLTTDPTLRQRQIDWASRFENMIKATFEGVTKTNAKRDWKTSSFIVVKTYGDDKQFIIMHPTNVINGKWRFMHGIRLGFVPACIAPHDFASTMIARGCTLDGIYTLPNELAEELLLICTKELPR